MSWFLGTLAFTDLFWHNFFVLSIDTVITVYHYNLGFNQASLSEEATETVGVELGEIYIVVGGAKNDTLHL